jgi:ribosome maturation factor RimP
MNKDVTDRVAKEAAAIAEPLGFGIHRTEFVRESGSLFLRVFIKSPGGVTIDDCARVSRALSKRLDQIDLISESYFLEVSSPGVEDAPNEPSETIKGDLV